MAKTVDVDQEREDGATDYVIGGRTWRAPEPSIDTFKAVLEIAPVPDDTERTPQQERDSTIAGLDTILPQLQLLLHDPEAPNIQPTTDDLGSLSVRRANRLLQDILGEGPAATT